MREFKRTMKSVLLILIYMFINIHRRLETVHAVVDDEHLCYENRSHTVVVPITKLAYYNEDKKYMCLNKFPPICKDKRVLTKTIVESKTIERFELVGTCCKGYKNVDGKCKPVCSERCFSQEDCTAPDYCVNCRDGFYGPFCDKECPLGFYTKHCNVSCDCPPGGHYRCDSEVGCICVAGFLGVGCDIPVAQEHMQDRMTTLDAIESAHVSTIYTLIPILLIALVLITLYYKRKIANLKDIINHLQVYTSNGSNYVRNFFPNPGYGNSNSHNQINPIMNPTGIIIKDDIEKEPKIFTDIDNCKVTSSKQCDVADTPGGHFYHTIESDNNLYEGLKENEAINWKYINNP